MGKRKKVCLALSIDVEEEGLFSGRYRRINPHVGNVAALGRLAPILERGVKPTMFCAWSVLANPESRNALNMLREKYDLEIGAHLHHWNTPPLQELPGMPEETDNVRASSVPAGLMGAKLKNLFALASDFNGSPVTSFRMGRWDLRREIWPLLLENGVKCDASIRPLHTSRGDAAPDHFDACLDPYLVKWTGGKIMEIPLTVAPLNRLLALPGKGSALGKMYRASLRHWGCLALLPVQHPLWLMKLTTLLHLRRGGSVLSLTWHSSEMMPGAVPHMRDEESVRRFLDKINAWLNWLDDTFEMRYETMGALARQLENSAPVCEKRTGDWNYTNL